MSYNTLRLTAWGQPSFCHREFSLGFEVGLNVVSLITWVLKPIYNAHDLAKALMCIRDVIGRRNMTVERHLRVNTEHLGRLRLRDTGPSTLRPTGTCLR